MDKYLSQEYCLSCVDNFLSKTGMPIAAQYFYDCFREVDDVAADVQPVKKGKWVLIDKQEDEWIQTYTCSECRQSIVTYKCNFCPNCGADMREHQ